ncbi:sensor histidine kinase [Actinomadura algeriensis]|uniref:histidine kinase n=1 Tax=Actinomadura algeriensis TaxID=1679523 RepID=A0ABR9K154_9ACTN|nr:histidine kinase [Actinomadura algeriensis]MBE1536328.1 signal transduction histidine kinase [Actinomadura algeriensis]
MNDSAASVRDRPEHPPHRDGPGPRPGAPASARVRARAAADAARAGIRRPRRAMTVRDTLLWAVLALPVAGGAISPVDTDSGRWWLQIFGIAALGGVIAVSRAWPAAALILGISLTALHGNFAFAMPFLAYFTGLRSPRARPVLWGFAFVLAGGTALNIVRDIDVTVWFPSSVWLVLLGVLPWLMGRYWRQYQELVRAGWERADRLEREQRIIAEQERLRERARIAQDMHDSLGHELALIAVRAGALQVAPGLQDRHRDAAAELRAGAADATEHLREIIGVLREDATTAAGGPAGGPGGPGPADAPTRPGRESITDLVERARASGVPVRLAEDTAEDTAGTGDGGVEEALAAEPMVGLAAHRVVQEAITNAAKHAPGAPVTVHLTRRPAGNDPRFGVAGEPPRAGETIEVTVVNGPPPEPPPGGPPLLPPGGGRGLTGLAERVRLAGGALHTGPEPGGGFRVTARLPADPQRPDGPAPHAPSAAPASTAGSALRATFGLPSGPDGGTRPGPGQGPPSESARYLEWARRRVRRGLITAIAVPAALLALLGTVMAGHHVYVTLNSVLEPADYHALRVGADQHDVEPGLPSMQTTGTGLVRETVPEPPGADCRYYRPEANLLGIEWIYRLCFDGGRLTTKDAYSTSLLSRQLRDRRETP